MGSAQRNTFHIRLSDLLPTPSHRETLEHMQRPWRGQSHRCRDQLWNCSKSGVVQANWNRNPCTNSGSDESNSTLGFFGRYGAQVSHCSSMHAQLASPELTVILHSHGHSRDEISHLRHAGSYRVSSVLDPWTTQSVLLPIGRPTKRTLVTKAFIGRRTPEAAHLGNDALAGKISDQYATPAETGTRDWNIRRMSTRRRIG
jgi:hypothetical protein